MSDPSPAMSPRLGALEAQVMDILWDHGPVTVREVIEHLSQDPAYTTIATVLTNLGRKDLVVASRQGHSTRHAARMTRSEYDATLMATALAASRDRAAAIVHFVDTMPEAERTLLREYLARHDPDRKT